MTLQNLPTVESELINLDVVQSEELIPLSIPNARSFDEIHRHWFIGDLGSKLNTPLINWDAKMRNGGTTKNKNTVKATYSKRKLVMNEYTRLQDTLFRSQYEPYLHKVRHLEDDIRRRKKVSSEINNDDES